MNRLAEKGYVTVFRSGPFISFSILPRMNHRINYWLDEFTKKFWSGFVVGFLSSLLASFLFRIIAG